MYFTLAQLKIYVFDKLKMCYFNLLSFDEYMTETEWQHFIINEVKKHCNCNLSNIMKHGNT